MLYNGKKVKFEMRGASREPSVGIVVKGVKAEYDEKTLLGFLKRRSPNLCDYSTSRAEKDIPVITPLDNGFVAIIKNQDIKGDGRDLNVLRPSHADYTSYCKYKKVMSGGGIFSGRMTAPLCVLGGILKQQLEKKGVKINAYISKIGKVSGASYKTANVAEFVGAKDLSFPLLDDSFKPEMEREIKSAKERSDSVGGVIECVVSGLKEGIGDALTSGIESKISELIFGIPAVKGIEFGDGFDLASSYGSRVNDAFYIENGKIKTKTNHSGGILGGISNGMPITFSVAVKPTPSIGIEQETVDIEKMQNVKLTLKGRNDTCIAVRAVPVVEAMTAIAVYDLT